MHHGEVQPDDFTP